MKSFGTGEYKIFVEMHRGENEMHYFMTPESRQRFLKSNKNNKTIKKMSRDPK